MKEGVVLCFKHRVPELWDFELTECVRPLVRLKGTEKFIRLSDKLIACQLPRRRLTHDDHELLNFGHSSEVDVENSWELHVQDDRGRQDESFDSDGISNKGHTLLKDQENIVDCKFVGNCDTLVCCSRDNFLRLFNVLSGELLSQLDIEEQPYRLGAYLGNSLVAVGLSAGARLKFIHAELRRDKDNGMKKG